MGFVTNIQYKGTDLCMDFNCPACGQFSHFDGFFIHTIECEECGATWEMPTDVGTLLRRVDGQEAKEDKSL